MELCKIWRPYADLIDKFPQHGLLISAGQSHVLLPFSPQNMAEYLLVAAGVGGLPRTLTFAAQLGLTSTFISPSLNKVDSSIFSKPEKLPNPLYRGPLTKRWPMGSWSSTSPRHTLQPSLTVLPVNASTPYTRPATLFTAIIVSNWWPSQVTLTTGYRVSRHSLVTPSSFVTFFRWCTVTARYLFLNSSIVNDVILIWRRLALEQRQSRQTWWRSNFKRIQILKTKLQFQIQIYIQIKIQIQIWRGWLIFMN